MAGKETHKRAARTESAAKSQRMPVSSERLKSFTDAVVAIAMTLLILPLINTIGDASASGQSTADWIGANLDAITLFALSFVLIAMF